MGIMDGRGRWSRWDKQNTTGDYDQLDIKSFTDLTKQRWGSWTWTRTNYFGERKSSISYIIEPGRGVRLRYSSDNQAYDYLLRVTTTAPNYGGVRYWWLCPQCGRRVRILYSGRLFLCRKCHGLTYVTSQASKGDYQERIRNRLFAIRRKLKAPGAVNDPFPNKPYWMHHRTYRRLLVEHHRLKELLDMAWMLGAVRLVGPVGNLDEATINLFGESVPEEWKALKQQRKDATTPDIDWWRGGEQTPITPEDWARLMNNGNRLALGELARMANAPYEFAQEAQREGLLRADQGRSKRRKRYRQRLKNWLQKLYRLRQAGLSWEDIRIWTRRRFKPGHEHERVWPEGMQP